MSKNRSTPIEISEANFKKIGYQLIDDIAAFTSTIEGKAVTTGETPGELQKILGQTGLPESGTPPDVLIKKATNLLTQHSLFNGHPKFLGYINSSSSAIGALADLLASAVNPNLGAQILSPIATEIERQTINWLSEFVGVPTSYGGLLVSGGNMANFTAFLAARTEKASSDFKKKGLNNNGEKLVAYCAQTTHTWIDKAAVLFGHGTDAIRWIATNNKRQLDTKLLEETIKKDLELGYKPFLVAGTAGDVSTGIVDNLDVLADICDKYNLWFHIDGAYGAPAAVIPELKADFTGIERADSIALDPHKWLYNPLEAGCTLVKNPQHLINTYSTHPEYYNFSVNEDSSRNYFEFGLQNSRGFRALKVWLSLQQVGKEGYIEMLREDISLSKLLFNLANDHPELEAVTQGLSITTLRYIPPNNKDENYLNNLNEELLNLLQVEGQVFLSNAVVNDKYCLRACIVNYRTSKKDIEEIIGIIVEGGREINHRFN